MVMSVGGEEILLSSSLTLFSIGYLPLLKDGGRERERGTIRVRSRLID